MNKIKIVHILHSVGGVDVSLRLILENIDEDKFQNVVIHGFNDNKNGFTDRNNDKIRNHTTCKWRMKKMLMRKCISAMFVRTCDPNVSISSQYTIHTPWK